MRTEKDKREFSKMMENAAQMAETRAIRVIPKLHQVIETNDMDKVMSFVNEVLDDPELEEELFKERNSFFRKLSKMIFPTNEKSFEWFDNSYPRGLVNEIILRSFVNSIRHEFGITDGEELPLEYPLKDKKFRAKLVFRFCLEDLLLSQREDYQSILKAAISVAPEDFKKELELAAIISSVHAKVYQQEGNLESAKRNEYYTKFLNSFYEDFFGKKMPKR